MSRPQSELTHRKPRGFSIRWTEEQHMMYLRLGGSRWLRAQLNKEIAKANEKLSLPRT